MKHLHKIYFSLLMLSYLSISELSGQERQYIFERLQGVYVQPLIYCMDTDEHGRLWYGTWGRGVFVYDVYQFTRFQKNSADTNSLVNDCSSLVSG